MTSDHVIYSIAVSSPRGLASAPAPAASHPPRLSGDRGVEGRSPVVGQWPCIRLARLARRSRGLSTDLHPGAVVVAMHSQVWTVGPGGGCDAACRKMR